MSMIDRMTAADALLTRWFSAREDVPPDDLAGLVSDLDQLPVRDLVWMWTDTDPGRGLPLARLLSRLAPDDPACWFLVAFAAWKQGFHGQVAEAMTEGLRADPTYSAMQLLATAITHGVRPEEVAFEGVDREQLFVDAREADARAQA